MTDRRSEQISEQVLYFNRTKMSAFMLTSLIIFNTIHLLCSYYFQQKILPFRWFTDLDSLAMLGLLSAGSILLPYSPKHFGFNLNRAGYNIRMGLLLSGVFAALAVILRWMMAQSGYPEYGYKLEFNPDILRYPLVSFLQEAVVKGYFQSYFVAMFKSTRWGKSGAILLSSLTFAQFHIAIGIPIFFASFLYACLTGWFYEQTRSLLGVTLVHFFTGSALLFFTAGPL